MPPAPGPLHFRFPLPATINPQELHSPLPHLSEVVRGSFLPFLRTPPPTKSHFPPLPPHRGSSPSPRYSHGFLPLPAPPPRVRGDHTSLPFLPERLSGSSAPSLPPRGNHSSLSPRPITPCIPALRSSLSWSVFLQGDRRGLPRSHMPCGSQLPLLESQPHEGRSLSGPLLLCL